MRGISTLRALCVVLVAALPALAEDLGSVVGSEAERRGDLETLRAEWWAELERAPDSEVANAILARWSSALGNASGAGPTALEWRTLGEGMRNGWNRRRALWQAHDAARASTTPWTPTDLGLDLGTPRDWLVIGPFGRSSSAELYSERLAVTSFDPGREEAGTHGPVRWRALPILPHETHLEPSRLDRRRGGGWIVRSRFGLATAATGFIQVTTRGSLRLILDGVETPGFDRGREHLPRVIWIPLDLEAGEHLIVLRSDGAPTQIRFTDASGAPLALEALPPGGRGATSSWHAAPERLPVGVPNLTLEPITPADRAARLILAAEREDLRAIDRLLPETPPTGDGAVPLAVATELALPLLSWLPSELVRSRTDGFRTAALAADPELLPILLATARTLAEEDRVDEAMRTIDGILSSAPKSLEAWLARESIANEEGWRRERSAALSALERIAPDHRAVLGRLQRAAQDLSRGDRMMELRERLFELEPTFAAGTPLARASIRLGRIERAEEIADRLDRLEPGSLEGIRLRMHIADAREDRQAMRALAERWSAEHRADDPDPWDDLADFHLRSGDLDLALDALREAASRDPGRSDRARRIAHLRGGSPVPGSEPSESWEKELIPLAEILGDAPPVGSYPGANAVLLLDQMISDVTVDGGIVEVVHQVIRLESQEAVEDYSTLPTQGELRELAVYTPDGRVLQPTGGASGGGYTLPGLEPGAIIVVRTVRRQDLRDPDDLRLGPFYFQDPDFAAAFHRSEWVVRLPAEWEPEIVLRAGARAPKETRSGGVRRIAWRVDRSPRPEPEFLAPPPDQILPNVEVRARTTWEEVLPQLAANSVRDDRPTPTLEAAAAEILDGISDRRAQVVALYEAACEHITDGGGGGSATEVWIGRDGNRELALAGLLRAAGIPFHRVYAAPSPERIPWVDWSNPRDATFGRVMIEIDDLGEDGAPLLVHIPFRQARFGRIPPEIRRGRALRVDRTGGVWSRIPDGDPRVDAQAIEGTATLVGGESPTIRLEGGMEIRAIQGSQLKEQIKDMPPFFRSTMLERFVQQTLPGAKVRSGKFEHFDERDPPLRIAFDVDAPSLLQDRDGVSSLASTILVSNLRRFVRDTERIYPAFSQVEFTIEERLTVRLGDDLRVGEFPEDVELEGPWGRFRAVTLQEGDELVLERLLSMRPFWLEADRWPEFVEFCRQVDQREEARISLEAVTP